MMLPDLNAWRSRSALHRCIVGKVGRGRARAAALGSVVCFRRCRDCAEFTAVLVERKRIKRQSSRKMMTQLSKRRHRRRGSWEGFRRAQVVTQK